MKVFLDTNVLVAAVMKQHVDHERSFAVLDRVHAGKDDGTVSAHSLAEMYAVMTKLPVP
jgi:predicted nucleic acid-binding protein